MVDSYISSLTYWSFEDTSLWLGSTVTNFLLNRSSSRLGILPSNGVAWMSKRAKLMSSLFLMHFLITSLIHLGSL